MSAEQEIREEPSVSHLAILQHLVHAWPMGCQCHVCERADRRHPHIPALFLDAEFKRARSPVGGFRAALRAHRSSVQEQR